MPIERTFVMIKPDGVARRLVGECIRRLERKGFKLVAMKLGVIDRDKAMKHYEEHQGKDFFDGLVQFISSGPVVMMVWEGENAVAEIRRVVGSTDPMDASMGTIRGDFGLSKQMNIIHASDKRESAQREIGLYFNPHELVSYNIDDEKWLMRK